jgi:carbon-monoxide dehydrogenase large subunit
VGESPTVGAPPAIANAIVDALSPFGITHLDIPITPYKIFKALKEKQVF